MLPGEKRLRAKKSNLPDPGKGHRIDATLMKTFH